MLTYMLDTNICIYVMKNYPLDLAEKFNALAEQLCMSSITLGELHYGAEKIRSPCRQPGRHPAFRGAPRSVGVRG
jgi:tRNA(fMet)-specific endonuclease VapC